MLDSTWETEKHLKKASKLKHFLGLKSQIREKSHKRIFRRYKTEMYVEYILKQNKLNIREGSFKNGDVPIKVTGIRRKDGEIYVNVNWKSKDDEPVENSFIKSELLTEICPKILCDYYEKHLKFYKKQGSSGHNKHMNF